MAITFPDPTGQPTDGSFTYTDPVNGQEYSWNGFGWDLICKGGSGGNYLEKDGDTATGNILLKDATDNTAEYDDATDEATAVNKKYVDDKFDFSQYTQLLP